LALLSLSASARKIARPDWLVRMSDAGRNVN